MSNPIYYAVSCGGTSGGGAMSQQPTAWQSNTNYLSQCPDNLFQYCAQTYPNAVTNVPSATISGKCETFIYSCPSGQSFDPAKGMCVPGGQTGGG